jgi:nucleotide-binding universal stress UspA family protein
MFRRILIPTDLTDRTARAVEVAAGIATGDQPQITLLHVIETIAGIEPDELASFYQKLEERARKKLHDVAAATPGVRGRVDIAIVYGRRAEEILQFARSHGVELIVLPSHPVDPSQPYSGVGTMSYKLAILAPCDVLLVK